MQGRASPRRRSATAGRQRRHTGIAFDAAGNLYIAGLTVDSNNDVFVVDWGERPDTENRLQRTAGDFVKRPDQQRQLPARSQSRADRG